MSKIHQRLRPFLNENHWLFLSTVPALVRLHKDSQNLDLTRLQIDQSK